MQIHSYCGLLVALILLCFNINGWKTVYEIFVNKSYIVPTKCDKRPVHITNQIFLRGFGFCRHLVIWASLLTSPVGTERTKRVSCGRIWTRWLSEWYLFFNYRCISAIFSHLPPAESLLELAFAVPMFSHTVIFNTSCFSGILIWGYLYIISCSFCHPVVVVMYCIGQGLSKVHILVIIEGWWWWCYFWNYVRDKCFLI